MARCFAVLGAPQVGKSTLVDHLASLDGAPPPSPAEGPALRVVSFAYLGEPWHALDCPGAPELQQDALDALLVADAAVIVVSPDPAQAVLAAPMLRAVERAGLPAYVFVNRMDEARGRVRDIAAALQDYAMHPIVLRQIPIRRGDDVIGAVDLVSERAWRYREGGPSALIELPADLVEREHEARDALLETLSEFDDWLLEEIVEEREPAEGPLYSICARVLQENRALPALIGAASRGHGVRRLMKALRHEAPSIDATRARLSGDGAPIAAATFAQRHRRHVGKLVWLRAFEDGLKAGASLGGGTLGVLLEPGGDKPAPIARLASGGIAAAVKSDHLQRAKLYGGGAAREAPSWRGPLAPQLARRIRPVNDREDAKLSEALAKLAEADPALAVVHDAVGGGLVLESQGAQHLRLAQETLADVFGVETEVSPAPPRYCESVTKPAEAQYRHKKQSGGAGQFADVTLTVAPAPRGAGFRFEDRVKGGVVPRNHIPAVEAGARDALGQGPLGFPVVDVVVTLTDGQAHAVDSSDLAFRIAGRAAVAQALAAAGPVLLEPYNAVTIAAPSAYAGQLVQIVGSHRGQVLGFDRDPQARGWDLFRALLPGAAFDTLSRELRAATQGVGRFEAAFDHFQELYGREADQVVAARAEALEATRR